MRIGTPLRAACLIVAALLRPDPAPAQDGACRLVHTSGNPPLDILQCPSGPTVSAETASDVHIIDPGGQGHPTGASVTTGGVLLDIPPGYPGGFQVTTPRAVASVRGTRWVVDVAPAQTSVLVLRGEVAVSRAAQMPVVLLRQGEGVDVGGDGRPLHVTRWPARRVRELLARFGAR